MGVGDFHLLYFCLNQPLGVEMKSSKLAVYIGYDPKEEIAWEVANYSLQRHSSIPINVFKLKQDYLRNTGLYLREKDHKASTEFSLTRFLTPYLANAFEWAIFVDCDFLFTSDVNTIFEEVDFEKPLHVVKHDYIPHKRMKMDGVQQTIYPRKNWSSFMLFNVHHSELKNLTPKYVNQAEPSELHQFKWLDDSNIGNLDIKWNFLEGEYPPSMNTPTAIHYTNGGPWFEEWQDVDYANLWLEEKRMFENSGR